MPLVWSLSARQDLVHIRTYIARHDPCAAKYVADRIRKTARRLVSHPQSGPPAEAIGTRRIVVPGTPYLMPYRIEAGRVVILRVLHGRQSWADDEA